VDSTWPPSLLQLVVACGLKITAELASYIIKSVTINIIMMIIMIIYLYPVRCTHMRFNHLKRSKSGDYIIYIATNFR
jgi:hypothetical protein